MKTETLKTTQNITTTNTAMHQELQQNHHKPGPFKTSLTDHLPY
jgi:hypothetical protein